MIVLSSFVFSIVMVMLGYAIWKYRAKPGDESDGEPIHGNTRLEIAWTVIPTVIVLFGAVYSWIVLDDIEAKALRPDAARRDRAAVQVELRVPRGDDGTVDATPSANELHVPVDRQLDVTISRARRAPLFWVPEWRIKRDAVPAGPGGDEIDNEFVVTPDEEGTFSLVCTELCGIGHATMRASVVVESQAEFDQWIAGRDGEPEDDEAAQPAAESGT